MGAILKFFTLGKRRSIFKFTIDTRNIVSGATDGSQNNLTFRLPTRQWDYNNCIIKVSDGRPDISITSDTLDYSSKFTLTFSTEGIYQVTIIGKLIFNFLTSSSGIAYGYDKLKIISIDNWGNSMNFGAFAFYGCSNLYINAQNTLVLPVDSSDFFRGIGGFNTSLTLLDTTKVKNTLRMVNNITTNLAGQLNPFWQSLIAFSNVYSGNTFDTSVNKIEIISSTLQTLETPWDMVVFQNTGTIELVLDTPNLKKMFRVFRNGQVRTRCHAGRIDVRNVTDANGWLSGTLTTAQVDATLLGWANLPFMQAGVTWNWNGSKYSNNPAVIAALNKITNNWGVIFTNLTMA